MTQHGFPDRLKEKVDAEIVEENGRLSNGMASDWPDYRYRCGLLAGLKKARELIVDLDDKESR